ncbi:YtzI protein [Aquibacillus sediminis]|uniref:YtzI protein n=1 Tax=Aquibacillus sediminis TaxID=2574734 RepID=UPI001107AB1D|nr:YtzI protein [Aquibacillus sediminis]
MFVVIVVCVIVILIVLALSIMTINKGYGYKQTVDPLPNDDANKAEHDNQLK